MRDRAAAQDLQSPLWSSAGNRLLWLARAVGASAERTQVGGGVEGLMAIDPRDEDSRLAEARELAQALTRFGDRTLNIAFAYVAGAGPPQALERQDAVVTVVPYDSDRVAADFIERLDDGSFRFRKCHGVSGLYHSRGDRIATLDRNNSKFFQKFKIASIVC